MAFSFIGKLWVIAIVVYLLDAIELIHGQSPSNESKKRRYKLISFYDDDNIKISNPSKSVIVGDLLLLSSVLNDTANTIFGSKDTVRDLLTFFADLDQIMLQWLFLFLIFSSLFHMVACACIGCCACYVFKTEIRSTLKFAKRQAKAADHSQNGNDVPREESDNVLGSMPPSRVFSQKTETHF